MGRPSHSENDAAIRSLLEPLVADLGLDLEELDIQASGRRRRVSVVVDRDGGIDLDGIAEASKAVSEALDSSDVMGEEPYTLEVTSPGVDRPLTLPRHWRRNVGRRVRAYGPGGVIAEGRLREVGDDGVILDVDQKGKPESLERRIPWPDLVRGEVQVEFTRRGPQTEMDESTPEDDAVDVDEEEA